MGLPEGSTGTYDDGLDGCGFRRHRFDVGESFMLRSLL